jgi:MFS family permease
VGNVTAAAISMGFGRLEETGAIANSWRWMFVVGAVPAALVVFIQRRLKEPERWQAAKAAGQIHRDFFGSYVELFSNPRWRRNAIVGVLLACAGIIGLWGIGFFSVDLIGSVLTKSFEAQGLSKAVVAGKVGFWKGVTSMCLNVGAFIGMWGFTKLTAVIGRRKTFGIAFVAAMLSTAMVFLWLRDFSGIFWMIPIMGVCQLSIFGGYAIYFPELFPTNLRSTGVSFCYNVGRFAAALGPTALGLLTSIAYKSQAEPLRYAGVTMCATFIVGLIILPFAPETKDQPLPENERSLAH